MAEAVSMWKDARPPLPVSVVATHGIDGSVNASCKSWWTPISYNPPTLAMAVRENSDSYRNIVESRSFTFHLPTGPWAKQALHTSKPLPYGENELEDQEIPWAWLELKDEERISQSKDWMNRVPYAMYWPWAVCRVTNLPGWPYGDMNHRLFTAEIVKHSPFEDDQMLDILLHRGRNTFVGLGDEYDVEPY